MARNNTVFLPKKPLPVVPHVNKSCAPFPKQLGASGLFSSVRRGKNIELGSMELRPVSVHFSKEFTIEHSGTALDADHQDAMLFMFKLAEGRLPSGNFIELDWTYADALNFLGKAYTASNRHWLRNVLFDLSQHHLRSYHKTTQKTIFSGSLISWADSTPAVPGIAPSNKLRICMSKAILSLYHQGYGKVDMTKRKSLGSSQVARLLQVEIACQPQIHFSFFVSTYCRMFGSKASLQGFKSQLKIALNRLQVAGIIERWNFVAGSRGLLDPVVVITNFTRAKLIMATGEQIETQID